MHTILNHKDLTGSTVGVREDQIMAQNCPILPLIAPYFRISVPLLQCFFLSTFISVLTRVIKGNEDKEQLSYIFKTSISKSDHKQELDVQMEQYELYKNNFVNNIFFDPSKIGLSKFICLFSFSLPWQEGVLCNQ